MKLIEVHYLSDEQVVDKVWPHFKSLASNSGDFDDQSLEFFANLFVKFIHQMSQEHENLLEKSENFLVKIYLGLC